MSSNQISKISKPLASWRRRCYSCFSICISTSVVDENGVPVDVLVRPANNKKNVSSPQARERQEYDNPEQKHITQDHSFQCQSASTLDFPEGPNYQPLDGDDDSKTNYTPTTQEYARRRKWTRSLDLPGGPNYRPFVGGYIADAYEAAKSLHYSSMNKDSDSKANTSSEPTSTS